MSKNLLEAAGDQKELLEKDDGYSNKDPRAK